MGPDTPAWRTTKRALPCAESGRLDRKVPQIVYTDMRCSEPSTGITVNTVVKSSTSSSGGSQLDIDKKGVFLDLHRNLRADALRLRRATQPSPVIRDDGVNTSCSSTRARSRLDVMRAVDRSRGSSAIVVVITIDSSRQVAAISHECPLTCIVKGWDRKGVVSPTQVRRDATIRRRGEG